MQQFISESFVPDAGTANPAMMSRGEPGLPTGFSWRGVHYDIAEVLQAWKTDSHGDGQVYLRRHWFHIRTACGKQMTIYFLRQGKQGRPRWWVYSLD